MQTIMIVDDELDDRYYLRRQLTKIYPGGQFNEAIDGQDALEQLQILELLPFCIFLDINMPRMNGKECLKRLKQDARLKNIPVIIYSTSNHSKDVETTMQLGASYYMTKPSDFDELPGEIKKALECIDRLLAVGK